MGWATFWANFSQTHLVTLDSFDAPGIKQKARSGRLNAYFHVGSEVARCQPKKIKKTLNEKK
jgi:hypothetical protein